MSEHTLILPTHTSYTNNNQNLLRYHSSHFDFDLYSSTVCRCSIPSQMKFVQKVMLIVICQLYSTLIFTVGLQHARLSWDWLQISILTWWIPLLPCILTAILIIWQLWYLYFHLVPSARITLLVIFTLLSSFITGEIVVMFCYEEGLLIMNMVGFGVIAFYLFTLQHRFKFSGPSPWFLGMGLICFNSLWLRQFFNLDALEILIPIGLAGVVCTYILLDLYYIMDNINADDVILANASLFIDLLYPMRCLHNLCELTDNLNLLDTLYPGPIN
ncbi:unnamed protein product [Cunninghamella blakesleeana]